MVADFRGSCSSVPLLETACRIVTQSPADVSRPVVLAGETSWRASLDQVRVYLAPSEPAYGTKNWRKNDGYGGTVSDGAYQDMVKHGLRDTSRESNLAKETASEPNT